MGAGAALPGRGPCPAWPRSDPRPAGPVSYQLLADDIAALLTEVVAAPAHLIGVSDGGVVALILAMQRPDVLRKVPVLGANFHHGA